MSAASNLRSEDQFLCSICLEVFTDPVSTPCGHNFCNQCITQHWNTKVICDCPLCNKLFRTRPELNVNTLLSEMVSQFRLEAELKASSSSEQQAAKPGEREQTCVCMMCSVLEHRNHEFVPLSEECEGKKKELRKTEAEMQQMIQERRVKIKEIRECVKRSKAAADREKAEGVEVFTALKECVERGLKQLMERMEEEEEVSVRPSSYEGTVVRAVAQLEETLSKEMKKLFEADLKRKQQFAVDVTLDPDTAHPELILSDDGKQVSCGDVRKNLQDNPERFDCCPCVLGKQSFSSGKIYFEVEVKGKTKWDFGITLRPDKGFWSICLRNGNQYSADTGPAVRLSLSSAPEKVGVFVDYEEGLVSFYDVAAAALIYSFTGCCFTEKLLPYFCPCVNYGGKNSAPLIICPVNQTV
uniref:Uncharacterized protein n=1 Tax=Salarias fasciatus TaxID=181472 RepID=A0A672HBX1_SALFA